MTINNGSIIESTELKLLIYHIRSMPTLGVLDSTTLFNFRRSREGNKCTQYNT